MKTIYLLDTNIIFNYFESFYRPTNNPPWWINTAVTFFREIPKNTDNSICIPPIVWSEFQGLLFHKGIDFKSYNVWYNSRVSVFNQVLLKLNGLDVTINYHPVNTATLNILSQDLTFPPIPSTLYRQIRMPIRKRINRLEIDHNNNPNDRSIINQLERSRKNLVCGKMLDGIDSLIVAYACLIARDNPEIRYKIVTFDGPMRDYVRFFHNHCDLFPSQPFPQNLDAPYLRG